MAISSPMNSYLNTITRPLTSLSLGLIMLPVKAIPFDLLEMDTPQSLVPHRLEGDLHGHILMANHVGEGAIIISFQAVALLLVLFVKFVTVWDTSLLIVQTATMSPSPETLITPCRTSKNPSRARQSTGDLCLVVALLELVRWESPPSI